MRQNRGLLRGEMPCFPPLTSTDYTARIKKILTFKYEQYIHHVDYKLFFIYRTRLNANFNLCEYI